MPGNQHAAKLVVRCFDVLDVLSTLDGSFVAYDPNVSSTFKIVGLRLLRSVPAANPPRIKIIGLQRGLLAANHLPMTPTVMLIFMLRLRE